MRQDKLSCLVRLLILLLPVFILVELNRRTTNVCPSSSQTDYASHIVRPVFTLVGQNDRRIIRLDG